MDEELHRRKWRLEEAANAKRTTTHWQLQIAAIENAFVRFFELTGTESKKIRGRASPCLKEAIEEPKLKDEVKDDEIKR